MNHNFKLVLTFVLFFIHLELKAAVYLHPGESALIGREQVYCMQDSSNIFSRDSFVDIQCLKLKKQNFPYNPMMSDLISWANECRQKIVSPNCQKISESPDPTCDQHLLSWYYLRPTEDELRKIGKNCRSESFQCHL